MWMETMIQTDQSYRTTTIRRADGLYERGRVNQGVIRTTTSLIRTTTSYVPYNQGVIRDVVVLKTPCVNLRARVSVCEYNSGTR
jgi:hypothetical protein